jgi:hypothetical protein
LAGVEHQRHAVADRLGDMQDVGGLLARIAIMPTMDLEGAVAEIVAGLGEVDEGLLAVEPAIAVAVIGRGIGLELAAIAAEELRDRGTEALAGEVPERDVDRPDAHAVMLAQFPLHVVPDLFAVIGIAAEDVGRQRERLRHGGAGAAPMHDILPLGSVLAADDDGELGQLQLGIGLVADIVDGARVLGRAAEIPALERELDDLDFADPGHRNSLRSRRHAATRG